MRQPPDLCKSVKCRLHGSGTVPAFQGGERATPVGARLTPLNLERWNGGISNENIPNLRDRRFGRDGTRGLRAASGRADSKSSDLLTNKQVKELVATAKTPADHVKLQKHFLALAAKYEAEAAEHAARGGGVPEESQRFMESKRSGGPGTAAHCDRFAELDREAAKEARELASAHEHMAAAAK